jgi:archaetidylinositol phosphate synthase
MNPEPGADLVRVHRSLLASAEKRLLIAIARRLPARINSDHLTLLGFAGMVGASACYWRAAQDPRLLFAAIGCLFVNWLGDSLDGTVARVRECQRPRYGFYVDHVLDALGMLVLFGGLARSGYMSPVVALLLLAAYYLMNIEIYLATSVLREFRMAFFGLGPTELRLVLAGGTAALFFRPRVVVGSARVLLFDVGGLVAAGALALLFVLSAARNTRKLYVEEPLPRRPAKT